MADAPGGDAGVLPRTVDVLTGGIRAGLHIGAQLHVRHGGRVVADVAVGEARGGVAMTPETSMIWFSSTKAATAVAAAVAWERGLFTLDDRVADHLPAFGANGKAGVRIRHLLTHTAGFRYAGVEGGRLLRDMDEAWADICAAPLEDGWVPGCRAGYHPLSTMAVVGKLIEAVDGRHFRRFVREEVFEPLGMTDCWVGIPPDRYDERTIGVMHDTVAEPRPLPRVDSPEGAAACIPGGGGRGPMAQLARLYEALRCGGRLDGTRILTPQTVEAIVARHRAGMVDDTFGVVIDWGLGLIVDSAIFGTRSSPRTYGHGGARSSVAFCDPEAELVVAVVCNGMPERDVHHRRMVAICDAIYDDLDLGDLSCGRHRELPGGGLL